MSEKTKNNWTFAVHLYSTTYGTMELISLSNMLEKPSKQWDFCSPYNTTYMACSRIHFVIATSMELDIIVEGLN